MVSRGLELTVRLAGQVVSSSWFPLGRPVAVGDSHLFDVFCPLVEVGDDPAGPERLVRDGFALVPVRGVHSVGARLFTPAAMGRVRLTLPAGVGASVGDERLEPSSGLRSMELALPFSGELDGAGDWSLRFEAHETSGPGVLSGLPRPGFFALTLGWGFTLVVGLLALGQLAPPTFTWEELVPGSRHRLAVLQLAPRKRPAHLEPEEPLAERISSLRVAPRRQARVAPRPQVRRSAPLLRAVASRSQVRLTHTEHVVDLTDPDAVPADLPEDGPPELDGPGTVVPVVPVAPPPGPQVAPPPPMTAPEPPPREVQPPKRLSFPSVEYPESARHLGLDGKVRLLLHIDRDGNVYKVEVLAGLHPTLDRAAVAAARAARYEPAKDSRGRPMASTATVTVRFELEEE